jgi:glycosyltransferase involved in cell wall biosynthesis
MYIHALLTRITGLTGIYSPRATRKLINYIRHFNPDIVHIHDPKTYYMNIGPLVEYLKQKHIKTIWTFHSEFMYTGKCGYAYDCEKWKLECGNCPKLNDYPRSLFFDFTRKMLKEKRKMLGDFEKLVIVAPSKWLADRSKQSFLKYKQTCVIHNGIDVQNVFHPTDASHIIAKYGLGEKKIVLAVAPDLMEKRKGGRWVIELAKKMKEDKAVFILIGIKDLSEKFDENIIPIGRTENQKELAAFYSLANAFLICSEKENFPTTCLEALSCGTPVIGFDAGGTKETAPEGYGIFVPYGDVNQLVDVVRLALQGKANLKSKQDCADFGLEHYSKMVMCSKYLNLYREV